MSIRVLAATLVAVSFASAQTFPLLIPGPTPFIQTGSTPGGMLSADLNKDGKADLLVNSEWGLSVLFWSAGFDTVEPGDLNGDGKSDLFLYNRTSGAAFSAVSVGGGFVYSSVFMSPGYTLVRLADVNGDAKAEVLAYDPVSGRYVFNTDFSILHTAWAFQAAVLPAGFTHMEAGDFNADGRADVFFYNAAGGAAATLITDAAGGYDYRFQQVRNLYSGGFTAVRAVDLNGDGRWELILYNSNTAAGYLGASSGFGSFVFYSLFWNVGFDQVLPRVNAGGKTDLVLYNSASGDAFVATWASADFTYRRYYWGPGRVLLN